MIVEDYQNKSWIQCRKEFLEYWSVRHPMEVEKIKIESQYTDKEGVSHRYTSYRHNYIGLKVCEMHLKEDKVCSSKDETYCYFNKYWNTRYIFPTEWVCEFDIDHDTAVLACCATIVNLIEGKYHFAVWYAEGMRSPHIHIYDLLPEDLDKKTQVLLRRKFTEKIVPKEYLRYVDKALFHNHKVCLEFAKHWKYGTHLKLLFEIPCS